MKQHPRQDARVQRGESPEVVIGALAEPRDLQKTRKLVRSFFQASDTRYAA